MAQLVEQLTRNEQVVRSSRISSSTSEWTLLHSDFSYGKNQSYAPSFLLFRKKARSRDVGVADCRWQSFCDLTESADESHPLQPNAMYTSFRRGGRPRPPMNIRTNIDKLCGYPRDLSMFIRIFMGGR